MPFRFPRFASGVLAATIAAGATVAVAQAPSGPTMTPGAAPAGPSAPMAPHAGRHGNRMTMELDRLKTSLRLNASQTALWDRAVAQMAPPSDAREKMRAMHERMKTMLDDPKFDPRRLAAEMDAADAERRARMASMRDAWFAVYDSLDPVQRGQVREFLRSRLGGHGMRGAMHDGMHGAMHDGMRGAMHDGDGPRPPMAGPPPTR